MSKIVTIKIQFYLTTYINVLNTLSYTIGEVNRVTSIYFNLLIQYKYIRLEKTKKIELI